MKRREGESRSRLDFDRFSHGFINELEAAIASRFLDPTKGGRAIRWNFFRLEILKGLDDVFLIFSIFN